MMMIDCCYVQCIYVCNCLFSSNLYLLRTLSLVHPSSPSMFPSSQSSNQNLTVVPVYNQIRYVLNPSNGCLIIREIVDQ